LLLKFRHGSLVEEISKLISLFPATFEKSEFVNDLTLALDNFIMEGVDHLVLYYVIVESVWNIFLGGFLMELFVENMAEFVPPSSKFLGRFQNVS
jgi:hypothetical protein